MKLSEIANPHIKISQWLDSKLIRNYTIKQDGTVDVNGKVDLCFMDEEILPVQFGKVTGEFNCSGTNLKSLQGMPYFVGGSFFSHNTKIISLSGIHKIIKQINDEFFCDENVTHILGLLLIKRMELIVIDNGGPIDTIMNKYRWRPDQIIEAQDELIDAGFKEQAKL